MECECQSGSHIFEDHFIPEIIDPETLEVLPYGELGELVFTTVTKEAMPLLRYRTRDLTRLYIDKCDCGRTLVRMEKCLGRSDDMLIIRGVNVFPSQIEEQILRDKRLAGTYQIILNRDGHLDNIEVCCEVTRELSFGLSDADRSNISKELLHRIKTNVGVSTRVNVMLFETLPRTEVGKARRVFDHRPKQN